jgi:hypothetical protein
MNRAVINISVTLLLIVGYPAMAIEIKEKEMTAKGRFDVELSPQKDEEVPAGRLLINKTYTGEMHGKGKGQMLSKRTSDESAYSAVEEFEGTLNNKTGGFTLIHNGRMSAQSSELSVIILSGSGTGELKGIKGTMEITQDEAGHKYTLSYDF